MLSEQKNLEDLGEESFYFKNIPEGYSGEEEDPGKIVAVLLHIGAFLFPFLFTYTIFYSFLNLYHLDNTNILLVSLPVSWFAADIASGIVHWLCDTYGSATTPVFGPGFIRVFRLHHRFPKDICISPFVFTIGYVAVLSSLILPVFIYLLLKIPDSSFIAFTSFTFAIVAFLTVLTNQFHKWAHSDSTYKWVRFLQKNKIILEPSHHKVHHTAPHKTYYCITHGWTNPILEKIDFFRKIEYLLAKIGFKPSSY